MRFFMVLYSTSDKSNEVTNETKEGIFVHEQTRVPVRRKRKSSPKQV